MTRASGVAAESRDRRAGGRAPAEDEELLAPDHDEDIAFLDFLGGLRAFTLKDVFASMRTVMERTQSVHEDQQGRQLQELSEARTLFDQVPVVQERNRLMRSIQELQWQRVTEAFERRRGAIEELLASYEQRGPGTLTLDPELQMPGYFEGIPYHLQPGGYAGDPLAGVVYHEGIRIFYAGRATGGGRQDDEVKVATVSRIPVPQTGSVRRVLDLACSVGQSTTALKTVFPDAEVHGVDLAAPMLRYAHHRAVVMGVEVHFHQAPAEHLRFDDGTFDIVYCNILFHEIPVDVGLAVIEEARRVLRTGGSFVVNDFTPIRHPPSAIRRYLRDFDTRWNGEPYGYDFVHSDFEGALARAFDQVRVIEENPFTTTWACVR